MFSYDEDDPDKIISCSFDSVNLDETHAEDIFQVESKWNDRSLLYSTIQSYAAATGWKATLSHSIYIRCSCYKRPTRRENTRKFTSGSLCKDCDWEIKIRSTENTTRRIKSGVAEGKYKSYPVVNDGVCVIISKANLTHTGQCSPSKLQQVMQRSRSGAYVKNMSDVSLFTICSMLKGGGKVTSSFLKQVLKSQFPSNKNVDTRHVYWMKNKIKSILPKMDGCENFNDFVNMFNTSKLPIGIDDTPLSDDNIVQMGKDLWMEIMNDDNNVDTIVTFQEYMLNLESQNRGFAVSFLRSNQGRITGCIWQTAIMRDNFERFGGFVSMDAMKRNLTNLDWPYMSISMYNELNSVCLACEGIVCGERVEAYRAMVEFVIQHNNKRRREDINVVAADGILNQEKVTNSLGLPNAIYMADDFHLLDSILPKKFGIDCYNLISDYIKQMIYSKTKEGFDKGYESALNVLKNRDNRYARHESSLREFEELKNTYASYILCKKKGTRGKHGSSISETNHASILVHLNDGVKQGNHYYEKPHTLVKDLFLRQEKHVIRWNQQMYDENNDLILLRSKINKETNPHLYRASEMLCLNSFKQFQERMERAKLYSKQMTTQTNATIRSLTHPSAPCRQCYRNNINEYFTCLTCESSIAREEQCVHSLNANDFVFIPEQFASYHFRRKLVSGSYISMDPNETEVIDREHDDDISDDDSEYSVRNTSSEMTADNEYSIEEQQGAFFEQLPGQGKAVKCLSASELKNVMDEILGNYTLCSNPVKKTINAIMISLNEMCITDGNSNGILDGSDDKESNDETLNRVNNLILEHRNTFLSSKNNFTLDTYNDSEYLKRSKNHFRKHKKNRLMSNRHKAIKKAKKYNDISKFNSTNLQRNKKKILSCKFCGSTALGERLSSCKKRAHLQGISIEYTLGNVHNGLKKFVTKIEHNTCFESDEQAPENYITVGENSMSRHFFIHRIWHRQPMYNSLHNPIENTIVEFSYITKLGDIDIKKNYITGKALHEMLVGCNLKKGPIFLYDKTPFKKDYNSYRGCNITTNSMTNYFSPPTMMGLSQNSMEYNNGMVSNSFSQISNYTPVFMNTLNVPNLHFGQTGANTNTNDNEFFDENMPTGHNSNNNFASM